ncbi:EamA family transporter [Candidatus Halobonum tyrrellensis]|uniref:EamA domain-containing protein n=1 Tax=Candidatus Halobonum tyrrellensis G22 TaxID=1324957 RepID=V4IWJ0_9EURY|nr:EamA family transporter [Candidatus Halobonum tyrrellensis]ESP87552.1 hypothetical protein K933_13806 [Candidatus Halobonum tyrrellensis G22]
MNYLGWALVALVGYSVFTPLASVATNHLPSNVVALGANTMLAVTALAVTLVRGDDVVGGLTGEYAVYVAGAGVALSVGILAYYRALATGPVSVVTPVYGSFLVFSSLLSVAFLDESLSATKVVGIGLTVLGVFLVAR